MKHEYHEGPEALEKFKKTATELFRVPKSTAKKTVKPAKKGAKNRKASTERGDTQR
jgi:hypothetical protein